MCTFSVRFFMSYSVSGAMGQFPCISLSPSPPHYLPYVSLPTLGSSSFVDMSNSWLGSQACCVVLAGR